MKAKAIGGGAYQSENGSFWIRPTVAGKKTWRKLRATTDKQAIVQAAEILHKHDMAQATGEKSPLDLQQGMRVGAAIKQFLSHNQPRPEVDDYLLNIVEFFGCMALTDVRREHCHEYAQWRLPQCRNGKGTRLVDLELTALSVVLTWSVERGWLEANPIRGRSRLHKASKARNCRETMPPSGDVLNDIAAHFFAQPHFEAIGWQMLFEALTGMRTCEALRLKWNAQRGEPGFVEGNRMDIQRAKKGVNPWVLITPDLRELMEAHAQWHCGQHEMFFLVGKAQLAVELNRLKGFPKVTSHGMRAFFVTKMRRDGHDDRDIAAMIGDKTVSLIQTTYGQPRPGEPMLSFRRADGTAAWDKWLALREPTNIIPFGTTAAESQPVQSSQMNPQVARTPSE